ncbi:MAG: VanZ family protein [Candidatus Brocadiales bacterium]
MSNANRFYTQWLRWLPVILYASLIFWASSKPTTPIPPIPLPHADKGIHFVEFAILCYLICWAQGPPGRNVKKSMLLAILITSAYGITDEYHQSFTPLRQPEVGDWVADTFGAVAAGLFWLKPRSRYFRPSGE